MDEIIGWTSSIFPPVREFVCKYILWVRHDTCSWHVAARSRHTNSEALPGSPTTHCWHDWSDEWPTIDVLTRSNLMVNSRSSIPSARQLARGTLHTGYRHQILPSALFSLEGARKYGQILGSKHHRLVGYHPIPKCRPAKPHNTSIQLHLGRLFPAFVLYTTPWAGAFSFRFRACPASGTRTIGLMCAKRRWKCDPSIQGWFGRIQADWKQQERSLQYLCGLWARIAAHNTAMRYGSVVIRIFGYADHHVYVSNSLVEPPFVVELHQTSLHTALW